MTNTEAARAEVAQILRDGFGRAAVEGNVLLGWIGGLPQYRGRVWELHPIVVRRDRRRRGIGRALVNVFEAEAAKRGALTFTLGTDDDSGMTSLAGADLYRDLPQQIVGLRDLGDEHPFLFYQKLGYVVTGVMPDANGRGRPDIYMSKPTGSETEGGERHAARLRLKHGSGLNYTPMIVQIQQEPPSALVEYAHVVSAFEVRERFAVITPDAGLGGLHLVAERVVEPYVKDYDAEPGQHPTAWTARFDLAPWGILTAWADGKRVGGAVVAWGTPGVEMLEGRSDLAVLWDLRVLPDLRRRGVGSALFQAAEEWALARGARWLKVETQNINVTACRFYARQGCTLGAVHRFAYPTLPDEAQLLWYKPLHRRQATAS